MNCYNRIVESEESMAKNTKASKSSTKESVKSTKAAKAPKATKATKAAKTAKTTKATKAAKTSKETKTTKAPKTTKATTKSAPKSSKSSKKILKLTPVVRLAVDNSNSTSNSQFGRGIANLCVGVRELGSLNAAAKSMGMAYSKAWRIVKDTESALGVQLLVRDGAHGSNLTEEGNMLLDAYLKVDKKLQEYALKEFTKIFNA